MESRRGKLSLYVCTVCITLKASELLYKLKLRDKWIASNNKCKQLHTFYYSFLCACMHDAIPLRNLHPRGSSYFHHVITHAHNFIYNFKLERWKHIFALRTVVEKRGEYDIHWIFLSCWDKLRFCKRCTAKSTKKCEIIMVFTYDV